MIKFLCRMHFWYEPDSCGGLNILSLSLHTYSPPNFLIITHGILDLECSGANHLLDYVRAGHCGLSCMQSIHLGVKAQPRERRLGVGIDEVSGIQFDLNVVLPRECMVLVPDVRCRRVDLPWQVLDVLQGDLELLRLATDDDPLEWLLPVEERHRWVGLGE